MERYPGELLVGVCPLVFCVDATIARAKEESIDNSNASRSQFDRFLDSMAASLLDEMEDPLQMMDDSMKRKSEDVMMSLFRGDDGVDSDTEDDMVLGNNMGASIMGSPNTSFDASLYAADQRGGSRSRSFSNMGFGRLGTRNKATTVPPGINTSYAKALQQGQEFFQRARIVSISTRHGFPPSKDADGEKNRINQFYVGKSPQASKILAATKQRPIDGILPSGWLEKHANALPSVLLVVVQVTTHQFQRQQDELLAETLESLQQSLASKRGCVIRIVGLVSETISTSMAEQWQQVLVEKGQLVTLLNESDLQQDAPSSRTLKTLHKSVRDASFQYYVNQARRTKHKLYKLGPARLTPLLLPLSIRYCFKVAMLYEFQWRHEKSLKYMVEAYRYTAALYRYLLQQRDIVEGQTDTTPDDSVKVSLSNHPSTPSADGGEGVEIALNSPSNNDEEIEFLKPDHPEDMVHQCRAVANWLNFKILQSGLVSHTEGGILASSAQWQKHCQAFCNPRRSFVCGPENAWLDWSFVAHQRVVISQLLERNPPKALGDLGNDFDEVLLRCSPWRAYEAAAEALLKLGAEVRKVADKKDVGGSVDMDAMRTRYMGCLDQEGYNPKLEEERKINHREKALDCILRAISLLDRDIEKAKKENADFMPWNRVCARLRYLAGGALLGLDRHAEATPYLEKAAALVKGWGGLELVIRRMLIECYEKHMPSEPDESSQTLASMLLDSYFNAEMSNKDLRLALEKFSSFSGGGTIKWYRDCFDEADAALPFSFALTFPSTTHAIAGDSVQASILIKSNLDYAVHVNSVTLMSLAGEITIPSPDLMSARNANEGVRGGIIIQAKTEIIMSTHIKLPKDLNKIAIDETGNGGEKQGVAGKGSFAKSARPRTGGITSAAGARMVSEKDFGDDESRSGSSQWSLKCLGGKPVRCDGLRLVFYPVHSATSSEGKNTEIELTIEKKQPKTVANIKRTPFEEENYIASAWMRPKHLPMNRGPRCLRVLPPIADMVISNLTEHFTNGKAMEGTVNRIVLKLKAGSQENCSEIKVRLSCSSVLVTGEGQTMRIAKEDAENPDNKPTANINNPSVRTPVLVKQDSSSLPQMTEFGYSLPDGWVLLNGGLGTDDGYTPVTSSLKKDEVTYAYFDVYRPSPPVTHTESTGHSFDEEEYLYQQSMCQTDIDITICYRQERPNRKTKQMPVRRKSRKKPGEDSGSSPSLDEQESDLVYCNHNIQVVWATPISAKFSPGLKQYQPSGNRHPTNSDNSATAVAENEMVLIDKERISSKCTLEAGNASDGLMVDIEEIRFEDNRSDLAQCNFKLLSGKDENGTLYKAIPDDPCRKLISGSKFSLAWVAQVMMESHYLKGSVTASFGMISVDWTPATIRLPEEVKKSGSAETILSHGPLRLSKPSKINFMGPSCYIESAPFETKIDIPLSSLKVAVPFEITYRIKNKTSLDQKLKVFLDESSSRGDDSNGFLISGLVNGDVSLGPFESHALSFTALATRAGKITMPQVRVSSERYQTWVFNDVSGPKASVFIQP